jgi:hypothetical protein
MALSISVTVLVPQLHAAADEGVAQIVDARRGMATAGGPTQLLALPIEEPMDRALGERGTPGGGQEWPALHRRQVALPQGQILLQGSHRRGDTSPMLGEWTHDLDATGPGQRCRPLGLIASLKSLGVLTRVTIAHPGSSCRCETDSQGETTC